ncbi:MAG: hypothetical protein ABI601_12835 [bacterium]
MTLLASELLFESEAALRMVDSAIGELQPGVSDAGAHDESTEESPIAASAGVPSGLLRAHGEIEGMLEQVRASRDVLTHAPATRMSLLQSKLLEVSTVSEDATTDILDALDQALAIVDQLDVLAASEGSSTRADDLRKTLRDELFRMMQPLQFQDITTQQLAYASSVIMQMEDRLTNLVSLFDPTVRSLPAVSPPSMGRAFDPNAASSTAADQARVDEQLRTR